jgi:hypothetical protein
MALTKEQVKEILSEAGIPSENLNSAVSKIMEGHTISLDYLRGEIKTYKEQAEKLPEVQKELDELKQTASGNDVYKAKYEAVQKELDGIKAAEAEKELKASKEKAISEIFKEIGLPDSFHSRALKGLNLAELELTKNNTLKDADALKDAIKSEWGDIIEGYKEKTGVQGAKVAKPPTSTGGNTFNELPLAEKMIYANEHPNDEQVAAWLKNPYPAKKEGGNE